MIGLFRDSPRRSGLGCWMDSPKPPDPSKMAKIELSQDRLCKGTAQLTAAVPFGLARVSGRNRPAVRSAERTASTASS